MQARKEARRRARDAAAHARTMPMPVNPMHPNPAVPRSGDDPWNQPPARTYSRVTIQAHASILEFDRGRWRSLPCALVNVVAWHQSNDPSRVSFYWQQRLHRTQALFVHIDTTLGTVAGSFDPSVHPSSLSPEIHQHLLDGG